MTGLSEILVLVLLLFPGGSRSSPVHPEQRPLRRPFLQAALLRSQGDYEKSFAALQPDLALARRDQRYGYQAKCLLRMGLLKWDLGDIAESERYFGEAEAAFLKAKDPRSQEFCAKCLEMIGLYNQGKDDRKATLFYRSIERFEAACLLGREIGFPDLQLKCLRQQSLTYLEMRKIELFAENSRKALDISVTINHKIEQGRCLNNIGAYYQQRHDYSQAVKCFEDALSAARTTNDLQTEAECLSNLGLVYRELGNLTQAQFCLSRAIELDERRGDAAAISMDLNNIGSVSLRRGLDEKSTAHLHQAMEAFERCLALQSRGDQDPVVCFAALNNMGIALHELKRHHSARLQFGKAMRFVEGKSRVLERCHVLCNIAESFLDEENIEDALMYYRMAHELSSRYSFENVLMASSFGLARCFEKKSDDASALSFYRRAMEAMEGMRARISSDPFLIGFARNKFGAFQRAIDILARRQIERPSPESLAELFVLIERAKARAFLESVLQARANIAEPDLSILKERQRFISGNISDLILALARRPLPSGDEQALKNELEHAEQDYIRLSSEMKTAGRTSEDEPNDTSSIPEIQRVLDAEGAVLLEYFLCEQRSYLVIVSPISAQLLVLPGSHQIEASLRAYLKLISDRSSDPRAGFEAAERIGRELMPFDRAEILKKAKALIVVPDGILHNLPFEAIRAHGEKGTSYLVEDLAVSYCPSSSALLALRRPMTPRSWKKDILAVGGSNYRRSFKRVKSGSPSWRETARTPDVLGEVALAPLPFSKKEVRDIARLFSAGASDVLTGDAASESTLKRLSMKDYRIIHFACHGFFNERYPFRSALALSRTGAREDDGFLQMREIYGLSMHAELVVLSACETGKGLLVGSEGLLGVARPFFFAGARSVIASLWTLNDQAAVVFMGEFYKGLIGGQSANVALRDAKMKMLGSKWAHPFYWAAFMLQGDPSAARMAH